MCSPLIFDADLLMYDYVKAAPPQIAAAIRNLTFAIA
mgnify:CR=1 FL=1